MRPKYGFGAHKAEDPPRVVVHPFFYLFPIIFKSITCDNGTEFSDCEGMEQSCLHEGEKRTKFYYCHPYSAYERGTNENINKMIRRFALTTVSISQCPKVSRLLISSGRFSMLSPLGGLAKMIRRFAPKGTSFEDLTDEQVAQIEEWVNNYPRGIFGFMCSEAVFQAQMGRLACLWLPNLSCGLARLWLTYHSHVK